MAWNNIIGTGGWEYDDTATKNDAYPDAPGTVSNGIRTYDSREVYISCRKEVTGDTTFYMTGELDKSYWDARVPFKVYDEVVNPISNNGTEGQVATGTAGDKPHDGVSFGLQFLKLDPIGGYSSYMRNNYMLTWRSGADFLTIGRGNNPIFTSDSIRNFLGLITIEDLSGNVIVQLQYNEFSMITNTLLSGSSGDSISLRAETFGNVNTYLVGYPTDLVNGQYYNVYLKRV